jgi:hypothetical protein
MDNHYHLVVRTDEASIASGMQELNARYAEHFNLAYGLTGHVLQGRYHEDHIDTDSYLLEAIRYVVLNPVRAGLCDSPNEWPWSSYGVMTGARVHGPWFDDAAVLALFSPDQLLARERFVEFIARGDPRKKLANTALRRRREVRDELIRNAAESGRSIPVLVQQFGVSASTVKRAMRSRRGQTPL